MTDSVCSKNVRVVYLLAYNGIMCCGFTMIFFTLIKLAVTDSITRGFQNVHPMMLFLQGIMQLEVVHATTGLVKTKPRFTFLQVMGRFLINSDALWYAYEIHYHPISYILLLSWSVTELFRYPYYLLSVINVKMRALTWLRYSVWIPIYPIEAVLNGFTIYIAYYTMDSQLIQFFMWFGIIVVPLFTHAVANHLFRRRKKKFGISCC